MSEYKHEHISRKARCSFYKLPCWINRVGYYYPDGTFSYEIKPCVWHKHEKGKHKGWPSCTAQLTCPYVSHYSHLPTGEKQYGALGKCDQECRDRRIRRAIEAWITLHPYIM